MKFLVPATILALAFGIFPLNAQDRNNTTNPRPIATVGDISISEDELDRSMGADLTRLESEMYQSRRRHLDELISSVLLAREAAKRGISREMLIADIDKSAMPVSDHDIDQFIELNAPTMTKDDRLRGNVRNLIVKQREEMTRTAYLDRLRRSDRVIDTLPHPPVRRLSVLTDTASARGTSDAPVTIVEFADFYCPYCRNSERAVNAMIAKYGDQLKLVFKDLPLDGLHPNARRLSEAGRCAGEQGLFWRFHDVAFETKPGPDGRISDIAVAQRVGADLEAFTRCLSSGRYQAAVQADVEEATRLGISGTPTFFVNGRMLVGVQSPDTFSKVIDEELWHR